MSELTQQEIDDWSEGKSAAEIADAWQKDSAKLRESLGIQVEDLPRGRGTATVENVLVSKIAEIDAQRETEEAEQRWREVGEAQAQNDAEGMACQRRFLERHPEFIPSEEAGNQLREAYLEIDPDATEWDDTVLEKAYCNMLVEKLELA
jgi:hypothetical protein